MANFGIRQWYGHDIKSLSPIKRKHFALAAAGKNEDTIPCPFKETLEGDAYCTKKGGVCTISEYKEDKETGTITVEKTQVTTCPSRFIDFIDEQHTSIFSWVSEVMLGTSHPVILKEVPFLKGNAGRIDWLIVDPSTINDRDPHWCALETQALYFSGSKMDDEFEAYLSQPEKLHLPKTRRPDYRSSGPKRLWPQLQVKAPLLRSWGKKIAVIVDRYFCEQMKPIADAYPEAVNDAERLDNAEVVWFIVDYDEQSRLIKDTVIFSTLEASKTALDSADPISKQAFVDGIRKEIEDARPGKVFSL